MNAALQFFHFPLLAKELAERASRRRTYVLRVVYAVLFFGMILWSIRRLIGEFHIEDLGSGGSLIDALTRFQLFGIHLFLPAMMCGAIARERESGSLPLLLLTTLSPGRIVLQKYLAGLVPMFTFLLLSTPLLAIAYALGGVTVDLIAVSAAILVLATCEVGALTLLCSACCRTTIRAFVATYVVGAILGFGVPWIADWIGSYWQSYAEKPWILESGNLSFLVPLSPIEIAYGYQRRIVSEMHVYLPCIALTLFSLVFARIELQRRTFRPERVRRPMRTWAISRGFRWINQRLGGVVFGRNSTLPEDRPILWREGRRFGLQEPVGVLRLGAWITAFAFAGLLLIALGAEKYVNPEEVDFSAQVGVILAGLTALCMMPWAASAFTGERSGETLAVLLTTPLGGREIVAQKAQFLTRVQGTFALALGAIFTWQAAAFAWDRRDGPLDDSALAWLGAVLPALLVYPQVLLWSGLWIGLLCRTARSALLVSLVVVAAILFVPATWIAQILYSLYDHPAFFRWDDYDAWNALVHAVSPSHFHATRLTHRLYMELGSLWIPAIIAHYALYAGIALAFRRLCLTGADRYLRRYA
jgi:ABC-type transport system involved in multi-copper enzyme maturation permease subunit